jgi:ketosteroid isomerase-like protein
MDLTMTRASDAKPVALLRAGFEVLREGGPDGLLARFDEFFSEDFEWTPLLVGGTPEGRGTYVGRKGFAEYWKEFSEAFGDPELGEPAFEALEHGRVLVTAPVRLAQPPEGIPPERDVLYLFTVREGRAVSGYVFLSREEAEEFLADA